MSFVDYFGVYLSKRAIVRHLKRRTNLTVLDIGCGYHANILRSLLPYIKKGIGIDVKISDQAKSTKSLSFLEGDVLNVLPTLPGDHFDLILMISVLEHLWQPQTLLDHCNVLLKSGGSLLINVPTWRGKFFLEFSAFKLGTSPSYEMDDHKMYYTAHDLWPMLVQAGFKPSQIHLRYIKFGLNLFAYAFKI